MSLRDLPNELIAQICEIADKDALMALRLTEKCISISATKSFSDRFMSRLSLIMTAPCLGRLIEICEHPSFGPGVRKIDITYLRMNPHLVEHLMGTYRFFESDRYQYEKVVEAKLTAQRCKTRYQDEEALKKQGGATKLLSRAFNALQAWGNDVELSITSNKQHDKKTSILPDQRQDGTIFLVSDCYEPQDDNAISVCLTSTLQPCLEAIRISKMQFRKLNISVSDRTANRKELVFNLKSFGEADMECFFRLKFVVFELKRIVSYETIRAMVDVVSQARELETLHLSHCGDACGPAPHIAGRWYLRIQQGNNALESIKSDKIKSLSFRSVSFSKQCLLNFLRNHRNTIKTLRLSRCKLGDGSWHDLTSFMKESLPLLSTLNINYLYDYNSPSDQPLSILGFGETWVKGENKVQAALSAMIRRPLDNPLATPANEEDEAASNT